MRQSKQTAQEIEQIERAEADQRSSRNRGLSMMEIRDRGWVNLSNGIKMFWDAEDSPVMVPGNHFLLQVGGRRYCFDAEEFRKWLRWA